MVIGTSSGQAWSLCLTFSEKKGTLFPCQNLLAGNLPTAVLRRVQTDSIRRRREFPAPHLHSSLFRVFCHIREREVSSREISPCSEEEPIVQRIKAPTGVFKELGGVDISTSSTALSALTDAFLYLYNYAFECCEQLSSRILGIMALRDILHVRSFGIC